jgi:hypothetical protein
MVTLMTIRAETHGRDAFLADSSCSGVSLALLTSV